MKGIFRYINRWRSDQKNLYIYFVIVLMVATLLLLVTEPMSLTTRLAFVLIPLAVQMALMAIFRKPGIMFWILLPKLILDAFQLILLYLFGDSIIAVDMFLNIVSTNATEAGELLGNLMPGIVGLLVLYVPALVLAVGSIRNKNRLTDTFRRKAFKWSLLLFVTGMAFAGISRLREPGFRFRYHIYPNNIFYNLDFAAKKFQRSAEYPVTSADFRFNAVRDKVSEKILQDTTGAREIYMLVIGETMRAASWSLYGYERETNPLLSQQEGLVFFKDMLTQSNTTHKSVPLILSYSSAENYPVIYHQKSIITAFKEAGFSTCFISNQVPNNSFTDYFGLEADVYRNVSPVNNRLTTENRFDGDMVPMVREFMDSTGGNLFIVLHTHGSHFNYSERYPPEFSVFQPDNVKSVRKKYKTELVNAFDNSVLYTDYVLSQLIDLLRQQNGYTGMLYIPDHGEDLLDDDRNKFLHASPIPTYYQLHVPFVMWLSPDYRAAYPEKSAHVLSVRDSAMASNVIFPTLLDLASISTPFFQPENSVVNRQFEVRTRRYLTDHEESILITDLRLKKQDYAMFRKMGIRYEFPPEKAD